MISIFVLSIGLFGLAALIPIGSYQVAQMNKLDRGGTLGRQAFREAESRGYLRPEMWLRRDGRMAKNPVNIVNDPNKFTIEPIMIDPLALDRADLVDPNDATANFFPYSSDSAADNAIFGSPPLRMPRVRLANAVQARAYWQGLISGAGAPVPTAMPPHLAERIFRGSDDLVFVRPDDNALRPQQMFAYDTPPGTTQLPQQRQFDGNYSWLMTVVPADSEETSGMFIGNRRLFTVSVVVFYRRKLPLEDPTLDPGKPASERMVLAEIEGNGLGGGSVHLEAEDAVNLTGLRPNGWMLLCGRRLEGTVPPTANRLVFRWYRIVSVDDGTGMELDPPHRDITVAGPDWQSFEPGNNSTSPLLEDFDTSSADVIDLAAIIVDDVVGVYEKTIEIDRSR